MDKMKLLSGSSKNSPGNLVYVIRKKNAAWIQYNGGIPNWLCTSIYDAYLQYSWEGSNFAATSILLNGY